MARGGGGAAAWVEGVLAVPGAQGGRWPGQQEIYYSKRVWQPVLANMLQYSCLENPSPWQRSLAGHRLQGCRVWHDWSDPVSIDARLFLPVAALPPWELSVKVVQLSGTLAAKCAETWMASTARVMALSMVFFQASCSWWSEALFAQSFSVALPVQALRGLPCLGSFSVVRHTKGPPWLGSYSVDPGSRHLKCPPGWGPTL